MSEPDQTPEARIKPVVFYGSGVGILAFAIWALIAPAGAAAAIGVLVGWVVRGFGWYYIAMTTAVLVFVIFLGVTRYGSIRLGPEHSRPEYGTFAWAAMLFAAGIGTDLMFFSVYEPVAQYLNPPQGPGETVEAAEEATMWTLFHYGISGWAMYALMGITLAYFAYRHDLPLAVRSALYPVFGKRIHGRLGDTVDLAAVVGTVFGVAASLGISVVFLNFGLQFLFGIPEGAAAQTGLVAVAVTIATLSAVAGVDKGIKRLSQLNVLLAMGLGLYLLVAGETVFLLRSIVGDLGNYLSSLPGLTLETFAYDYPEQWMTSWTLFFWAWWVAWASFIGVFLARVSRGRTIRQLVFGSLIIPFCYVIMWVSIFGNSAVSAIRSGNTEFAQTTMENSAAGFYLLLAQYPAATFVASIATFVGLLSYVTSADAAALVTANLSSRLKTVQSDASTPVRIFWAVATGLLTIGMLIVGGVPALQNATIIAGLPFAFVMLLVMFGLYKALQVDLARADTQRGTLPALLSGRSSNGQDRRGALAWRQRVGRAMSFPGEARTRRYVDEVALPALQDVAEELRNQQVHALAQESADAEGPPFVEVVVELGTDQPFRYQIRPHKAPLPVYGGHQVPRDRDSYYRLEVHLREGGQGYDVMGYTHVQLLDDITDQYEAHLAVLQAGEAEPV